MHSARNRLRGPLAALLAAAATATVAAAARAQDRPTVQAAREALVTQLNGLAAAQAEAVKRTGAFATSLAQLMQGGFTETPGVSLVLLVAARDGWSAVATHDQVPQVRCAATGGSPLGGGVVTIACQDDLPVAPTGAGATIRASSASVADSGATPETPPKVKECKEPAPSAGMLEGVTLVSYIVDADGLVEPAGIRILQSPAVPNSIWAIAAIASCVYEPAMKGGEPVRATVTRRVRYTQVVPPAAKP